jgi:amidophosphoribosyltransferase
VELRRSLEAKKERLRHHDSEVMLRMVVREADRLGSVEAAVAECMPRWQGAYSLVLLTETHVIAVRDPYGVRPLCIGRLNGGSIVFASESCALSVIGAELERDIDPGEVVVAGADGVRR